MNFLFGNIWIVYEYEVCASIEEGTDLGVENKLLKKKDWATLQSKCKIPLLLIMTMIAISGKQDNVIKKKRKEKEKLYFAYVCVCVWEIVDYGSMHVEGLQVMGL